MNTNTNETLVNLTLERRKLEMQVAAQMEALRKINPNHPLLKGGAQEIALNTFARHMKQAAATFASRASSFINVRKQRVAA